MNTHVYIQKHLLLFFHIEFHSLFAKSIFASFFQHVIPPVAKKKPQASHEVAFVLFFFSINCFGICHNTE